MLEHILKCRFTRGQVVCHNTQGYRGVIVDMAPYEKKIRETNTHHIVNAFDPTHGIGYWVLIDQSTQATYAPEDALLADHFTEPIDHPLLDHFFTGYRGGAYSRECDA